MDFSVGGQLRTIPLLPVEGLSGEQVERLLGSEPSGEHKWRALSKNESPDRLRDRGSLERTPRRLGADDGWLLT
jgi:hypothetical protein